MKESEIQRAVFEEIETRGLPGIEAWPVPNNREARRCVGFRAGVSDVHILRLSRFYVLELKTVDGTASQEQLEYTAAINLAGGKARIAKGLPEALRILEVEWELLRKAA